MVRNELEEPLLELTIHNGQWADEKFFGFLFYKKGTVLTGVVPKVHWSEGEIKKRHYSASSLIWTKVEIIVLLV